ncbi:MAG: cell division protein ZapD [Sedimenticola sp.]
MSPVAPDKIIYEHPLNERVRTLLRLEHLFREVDYHAPRSEVWASRAAISSLLDMASIFSRADIKTDLIKELKRHQEKLQSIDMSQGVDTDRLQQILNELKLITEEIHDLTGQIGQSLRNNEFLKSIMQRSSIPGGNCTFDLPLYHHWLEQSHELRQAELQGWISTLKPVESAVSLILSLIRGSTRPTTELAVSGFFQRNIDAQTPAQLIRVGLPREGRLFAEISGGKHRFSVRFMDVSGSERPSQTKEDVAFFLNCCIL